jgi:hypothetical protein
LLTALFRKSAASQACSIVDTKALTQKSEALVDSIKLRDLSS